MAKLKKCIVSTGVDKDLSEEVLSLVKGDGEVQAILDYIERNEGAIEQVREALLSKGYDVDPKNSLQQSFRESANNKTLFQNTRGYISFSEQQTLINISRNGDLSTFLHGS